jgi:hypothetical protein
LQAAVDAIGEMAHTDDIQLALVLHDPKRSHPSVGKLLEALRAQPALAIFDGKMQVLANQAMRMDFSNLAGWLIRRGRDVGSAQAVADLQRYVDASEIPFCHTFGLTGLRVDCRCDLGFGIALIPWDNLPNSYHKHTIYTRFITSFGFKWPSAAVIQERILPKLHVSAEEERQLSQLDDSELYDALLCIGAAGPFAPEVLVSWLDPPPWAPVMGVGYSMPHLEGRSRHDVWTSEHCEAASQLFKTFRTLRAETKDALRVPLQRLGIAMRRLSNVDSAIDLGIALEALFLNDLPDDRSELTFRLRLRVARYLEQDSKKREALFRIVGDLYALRSAAVHTGRTPKGIRGRTTSELLEEGFRLTATAIRRHVYEGTPDWNNVQLS